MLVKKKTEPSAGQIFAMKVMRKSVVVAHGQLRHALAERLILANVDHPFIVQASEGGRVSELPNAPFLRGRATARWRDGASVVAEGGRDGVMACASVVT